MFFPATRETFFGEVKFQPRCRVEEDVIRLQCVESGTIIILHKILHRVVIKTRQKHKTRHFFITEKSISSHFLHFESNEAENRRKVT